MKTVAIIVRHIDKDLKLTLKKIGKVVKEPLRSHDRFFSSKLTYIHIRGCNSMSEWVHLILEFPIKLCTHILKFLTYPLHT